MARVKRQYIKEIKNQQGYHVAWHPGVPLALGDIGTFDSDGGFRHHSNVKNLKIGFDVISDKTGSDINYESSSGVETIVTTHGRVPDCGSVLQQGEAGVMVKFSKAGSILLKTKNARHDMIKDCIKLENDIKKLFLRNKWKKEWFVITELVRADSGTVLISNSADSVIELKANADVKAVSIDIADASFKFSVGQKKNLSCEVIAKEGITPLFRVKKYTRTGDLVSRILKKGHNEFELKSYSILRDQQD